MSSEISIGEKIMTYRKLKNMTQEDLSKESDLYVSTIKKYEAGERKPKPDDQNINKSICSYLEYKRQLASIPHPETDTSITQNPVSALDENKNRLLLTNKDIKKIR